MPFTNELTGASGSYTVGGSTINYTATATGGDLGTWAAGYGGIDSTNYYIGNDSGVGGETYTYAFDQTIAGLQINVNAMGTGETIDFIINGVDVDLNTLIANGDVTVVSTDNGTVDGNGDLIGNSTEGDGNVTSLQFNIPIDSIGLVHTGFSGGALVEIITSDQPVPDGTVEGTTGDDLIDASYAGDPEGDFVDAGDAVIPGDSGDDDRIHAGDGNDTVLAGSGDDIIVGGEGDDTVDGGIGDDLIIGDMEGANGAYLFQGNGDLTQYNPLTGQTDIIQSGLQTYGDIAQVPSGQIYGVIFSSGSSTTDAGIYEINPDTGVETLVHDLPDDGNFYAALASAPNGNLYLTNDTTGEISILTPDGSGGLSPAVPGGTVQLGSKDLVFVDDDTVWLAAGGTIYEYDVNPDGSLANETNLGTVSGQSDIFGLHLGEDGLVYATEGSGEVYSAEPSAVPLTWTEELPIDGALVYGAAAITTDINAPGNDVLYGGAGNDTIYGGAGDDSIDGGAGIDSVSGGTGDDYIDGGFGTDVLDGGDGNDTVSYLDSFGNPTAESLILDLEAGTALLNGTDNEIATNFENAISGDTTDTITGTAGANEISSGGGNDSIDGGGGNDSLLGGAGDDTLYGGFGIDTLEGEDGADLVDGGQGDDVLSGGLGNDTILANFGTDTMDGGDGIDTYDVAGSEIANVRYDVNLETGFDQYSNQYFNIENVIGGDDGDSITGDDVDNVLDGDGGNDTIDGGAGNDTVIGGVGNDVLAGGAGSDVLTGGLGDDSLVGDDGDAFTIIYDEDFSSGAAGWSNPTTENDAGFGDILGRFAGSDGTIATQRTFDIDVSANEVVIEFDALLIDSWNGEDFIITVNGEEVRLAHLEGDTFDPASQSFTDADGATYTFDFTNTSTGALGGSVGTDDTVMGVVLTIENPPSSVTIGFGTNLNSTLDNESFAIDNFSIVAFEESDDTLAGGAGDDVLTGGGGDDVFIYNAGDGNDTITDFNADNTGPIDDGDQTNNDFIDLNIYYDDIFELRADLNDDGLLNQSGGVGIGNVALGGTIDLSGVSSADLTFDNTNVACFTAGCMIKTKNGEVAVEDLCAGMLVHTMDSGLQSIRAVMSRSVSGATDFAPVVISKGALGNEEELVVSPAHRMLISDWRAEFVFGQDEVLASAKSLCNGDTIYRRPVQEVTYFHILLDQHEIIYAAGCPTESYHMTAESDISSDEVSAELRALFPELNAYSSSCVRPSLRYFEVQALQALTA